VSDTRVFRALQNFKGVRHLVQLRRLFRWAILMQPKKGVGGRYWKTTPDPWINQGMRQQERPELK
jgi:hypothetical protein